MAPARPSTGGAPTLTPVYADVFASTNGRLYVFFGTTCDGQVPVCDDPKNLRGDYWEFASEIGYLTSTDGGATFGSYERLMHLGRHSQFHFGGSLVFGRDGYLYITTGDSTDSGAPQYPNNHSERCSASIRARSDCFLCHTTAANRALGPEIGQLNGTITYPATGRTANQLATLDAIGMFASAIGDPATMDSRFATPIIDDFGNTNNRLIKPGSPSESIVSLRMHSLDARRMPPLATSIVHAQGTNLIDSWIGGLTACP